MNPYESPNSPSEAAQPLAARVDPFWAVWAVVAAFGTYFCMYAFRKPFTAASYEEASALGASLKPLLIMAQVFGYMVSKFIGIKVIAEMPRERRAAGIVALILIAQMGLVLFGLIPPPWNAVGLFVNGLALGMVFGLVLGFLEGRQFTEALTASLCASFILADGVTKSVGAWLLSLGVPDFWMPSAAGLCFFPPLLLGAWMLSRIPAPSAADVASRTARERLLSGERWSLLSKYAVGLTLLVFMYLLVTILRSLRADFAPEIWRGLGEPAVPGTFTWSEIWVALGVLVANGCAVLIRENRAAFFAALGTCGLGFVLIVAALLARQMSGLTNFGFMVLLGLGLYLPYVAMHTTIFERLLAMTRERGNIGFLMYVADSFGYLGYVAVVLYKFFRGSEISDGQFIRSFELGCWVICGLSLVCLALCWIYFAVRCPAPALKPAVEGAS